MRALNPRDLPEKRQQLVEWITRADDLTRYPPNLGQAQLIYVTREMCQLARAAARTLSQKDLKLNAEDLPSPSMFIYFEDHKFTGCGNAVSVTSDSTRAGFMMMVSTDLTAAAIKLMRRSPGDWEGKIEEMQQVKSSMTPPPFITIAILGCHLGEVFKAPDHMPDEGHLRAEQGLTFGRRIVALFRLIQQGNITEDDIAKPMKRFVDYAKKQGQPKPKSVRVISLMKSKRHGKSNGQGHTIDFRFLVRGHWRQQWYPSAGEHRPVWIKPHVRGPEDAPFVDTTKVYKA